MKTCKIAGRIWRFQCRWPFVSLDTGSAYICDVIAMLDRSKLRPRISSDIKNYFRVAWPATAGWLFSFVFTLFNSTVTAFTLWCQFGILALLQVACLWLWRMVYRSRIGRVSDEDDAAVKRSIERTCRNSELEFKEMSTEEKLMVAREDLAKAERDLDAAKAGLVAAVWFETQIKRELEKQARTRAVRDAVVHVLRQNGTLNPFEDAAPAPALHAAAYCPLCFGVLDAQGECTRNPEHRLRFNHPMDCACADCNNTEATT